MPVETKGQPSTGIAATWQPSRQEVDERLLERLRLVADRDSTCVRSCPGTADAWRRHTRILNDLRTWRESGL